MTKLLAVDDSRTMRKVLEITFAGENYETLLAETATEAIEKLHQSGPQLAIVDLTLGDAEGYDLCQRIKSDSPQTRVLMLSSKQNPYDAGRGAASGADSHIDKPFDTQVMLNMVEEMLAQRPAQERTQAATAPRPLTDANQAPAPRAPTPAPVVKPVPAVSNLDKTASQPFAKVVAQPAPTSPVPPRPAVATVAAAVVPSNGGALSNGRLETKLESLGLDRNQIQGVLALTKDVVEQAVWEVVPAMAETLIKEELARLTAN